MILLRWSLAWRRWRSPSCRRPTDAEAKAKAAETAAKTAWQAKVDAYQLCKAQDKVAAQYMKTAGKTVAAKDAKPVAAPAAAAAAGGRRVRHACRRGRRCRPAPTRALRLHPARAEAAGGRRRALAHRQRPPARPASSSRRRRTMAPAKSSNAASCRCLASPKPAHR